MFQEPQILPWLARKSGVPFPVARAIWRSIARKTETGSRDQAADELAGRQINDLRQQLKERGRRGNSVSAGNAPEMGWVFPLPLFQAWAECQTRILLNSWLAWFSATKSASGWSSHPPVVGG
jgi:hypothetical protein